MGRTKNPLGDSVSIYRKGISWRVRYCPTSLITEPSNREDPKDSYGSKAAAEVAAHVLRTALFEHRNAYRPWASKGDVRHAKALARHVRESRVTKKAERRARALTSVNEENYSSDGDGDTGIGLEDVPTLVIVSQLSSAVRIVESRNTHLIALRNWALSPDTAWQTSQEPMLEVATGLRLNETLGLQTSRFDPATLTIGVSTASSIHADREAMARRRR